MRFLHRQPASTPNVAASNVCTEETPVPEDIDEVGTRSFAAFEAIEADPVEAQLQGLDPPLRTDSLRAALADQQRRQGNIERAEEAVGITAAALASAVARGSAVDGGRLVGEAEGAEKYRNLLPSDDLDLSGCSDTFRLAVGMVNDVIGSMPTVPALSFTLETSAWRTLPAAWLPQVPPPTVTPEVAGLEAEIQSWNQQRDGIRAEIQRRQVQLGSADGGGLQLLGATRGLVDQITEIAAAGRELQARVEKANSDRLEAGLEWSLAKTPRIPLDQWASNEVKALRKHRATQPVAV
jgi:hypothetical protein